MNSIRAGFAWLIVLPALAFGCRGEVPGPPATRPVGAIAAPDSTRRADANAATTRPAAIGAVPRNDIAGLPNFARVSPTLYRGAQPTAAGFAELKRMGVKTVVSLRAFTSDRSKLEGTGLRYVRIPCLAWSPGDADVVQFLKVVTDPANQPVFVHCQHGADRTGYAVAVYRVMEQGWAMEDAMREMHNFGFHTIWWMIPGYLRRCDVATIRDKVKAAASPKVSTP